MITRKKRASGFTLVEAMVAMLVFAIALMGLVALQKVSIDAASMGRSHTMATNVARFVMTWLQNEAASYATTAGDTNFNVTDYPLLFNGASAANLNNFILLDSSLPNFRFDEFLGDSSMAIYDTVDTAQFCVHYRLRRFLSFQDAATNADTSVPDLFLATVRVSWPKDKSYKTSPDWTDCDARTSDPSLSDYNLLELNGVITREFANRI